MARKEYCCGCFLQLPVAAIASWPDVHVLWSEQLARRTGQSMEEPRMRVKPSEPHTYRSKN